GRRAEAEIDYPHAGEHRPAMGMEGGIGGSEAHPRRSALRLAFRVKPSRPERAGRVVEQLVDREASRNELLPHGIIDDDLERGAHGLEAEADRRRLIALRPCALLTLDQQLEHLFRDVGT